MLKNATGRPPPLPPPPPTITTQSLLKRDTNTMKRRRDAASDTARMLEGVEKCLGGSNEKRRKMPSKETKCRGGKCFFVATTRPGQRLLSPEVSLEYRSSTAV